MSLEDINAGIDNVAGTVSGVMGDLGAFPLKSLVDLLDNTLESNLRDWIRGDQGLPSTIYEDKPFQGAVARDFMRDVEDLLDSEDPDQVDLGEKLRKLLQEFATELLESDDEEDRSLGNELKGYMDEFGLWTEEGAQLLPAPTLASFELPTSPVDYYVSLPSTSLNQSTDPSNNSGDGAGISGGRSLGGGHEKPDNSTGGGSGSASGSVGTGSTGGTAGGTAGAGSSTGGSGGSASGGGASNSGTGGGGADAGQAANPPGSTTNRPGQVSGANNQTSPNRPDTDLVAPVLLDLDGNGVKITEFGTSTQFTAGKDGLLHRSSWAGAGDGVLFYDPDGRNAITEERQYVFTDWAPTAQGDLEAIRQVWDTNGDGKLTSADAEFAKFKVMVTNADGSTSVKTLAELGITEINLTANATEITLPDGSRITGQTTFTRANGTPGTVANTTLVTDAAGYRVEEAVGSDGVNRVVTQTAYAGDGGMRLAA